MLVVAALAPARAPGDPTGAAVGRRSQVAHLVTAGSPLRSLYLKAFPRYVDAALVSGVDGALAEGGRWTNVFRFTDHVGRSVFVDEEDWRAVEHPPEGEPQDRWWCDVTLPDGFVGRDTALSDPAAGQEAIRGHNDYWTDERMKEVVG